MTRILTCLMLVICLVSSALAQTDEGKTPKMLEAAKKNGTELPVNLSVNTNVRAQAVLIPQIDARRIFGKEIADNYAVIQLIVSNKSSDAALIIHGIFIDYSRWALSGSTTSPSATIEGRSRDTDDQFQAATNPNHIASEEYRVVRGQLLDAQMWTKRNWLVRALTFAASLAGAGTFAFNEKEVQLIAALNGSVVPGVESLWPDRTVDQLNRVSDFGYQTNKVIAQRGSEVIVCFFPIDRFLTPGFRRLFLKSPALFFAPLLMLADTKIKREVASVLGSDLGPVALEDLRTALPCYVRIDRERREGRLGSMMGAADSRIDKTKLLTATGVSKTLKEIMEQQTDQSCLAQFGLRNVDGKIDFIDATDETKKRFGAFLALDYISQTSLNSVTVVVDGVMTVDTLAIAAKIDGVGFEEAANCGDHHKPCFWTNTETNGGVRNGTIDGSYLTGGQVKIMEADALGLKEVKTTTDSSSDQVLHFSFKLTKPIDNQIKLHFVVAKPLPGTTDTKNPKAKDSLPWEYVVDYGANSSPAISDVKFDASQSTLTVNGDGFIDAPPKHPLVVTLQTPTGEQIKVSPTSTSTTKLTIPVEKKTAGCWSVVVSVGAQLSLEREKNKFMIATSPTLGSAKRQTDKKEIVVNGDNLVDTTDCSGKKLEVSFQLVKVTDAEEGPPILLVPTSKSQKEWTFNMPHRAQKPGTWKVKMLFDGKDVPGVAPVALQ
jgi:hypothetical protein